MSSIVRPPDPCLVAIILVVRSRAGPRFVYHYPPTPSPSSTAASSSSRRSSRAKSSESATSSDAEAASSSDDEATGHTHTPGSAATAATSTAGKQTSSAGTELGLSRPPDKSLGRSSPSPHLGAASASLTPRKRSDNKTPGLEGDATASPAITATTVDGGNGLRERRTESGHGQTGGSSQPPWDTFLGLKTDVWEKLLSPAPAWHKRRFEVGVNDLAFVGWPVFSKGNGGWKKRRKKEGKEKRKEKAEKERQGEREAGEKEDVVDKGEGMSPRVPKPGSPLGSPVADAQKPATRDQEMTPEKNREEMTMFNVVFVLDPPILEYHSRLKEKYENVIKKFGKGLKSEQSRADYVWNEAQKISHIKEKARENGLSLSALYSELLSKSTLAQAISTVYSSISNSKIASVTLTPQTTMSLQVPPLTSTPSLPSITEPSYPGLWLTTADSLSATDEASGMEPSGPSKVLAKNFALLLLSDEATILKDIEASMGSLGPPLAHYIRCSKPNKSFAQISAQSQIPLSDIQILASHLVYWRRARAIPPLNQRDTYIVSPNADMSKLGPAAAAYEVAFPTLPSLPKMLSALSGTPRPYSSFIPSKDHKQIYFDILAWLMRGGWVTQLRTFGWIKADLEIKRVVADAVAKEEEASDEEEEKSHAFTDSVGKRGDNKGEDNFNDRSSSSSSSLDSEASGGITPIPGRATRHPSSPPQPVDDHDVPTTASLIPHPHRASPLESLWLDEILARFPESHQHADGSFEQAVDDAEPGSHDTSLQRHWSVFTKYFNGTDALEKIPVREGLKRKLVWRVLSKIDASSDIPSARGITGQGTRVEANPREKVLVTVRHW